jgi:hypothetical protein
MSNPSVNGITHIFFEPGSQVEVLGQQAFINHPLTYFEVPSSLREVGSEVFKGNNSNNGIKVFDIPLDNSLSVIGPSAFQDSPIEECDLSKCSNLRQIQSSAFQKTTHLQYFDLPEGVTVINNSAFNQAFSSSSRVSIITLPGSLRTLGRSAYTYLNLTGESIDPSIQGLTLQIGSQGHPTQLDFNDLKGLQNNDPTWCVFAANSSNNDIAQITVYTSSGALTEEQIQVCCKLTNNQNALNNRVDAVLA